LHFWPFLTANWEKLRIVSTKKMIEVCATTEKLSETFIFTSNSPLYGAKLIKNGQKLAKIAKNRLFSSFLVKIWVLFCIYSS